MKKIFRLRLLLALAVAALLAGLAAPAHAQSQAGALDDDAYRRAMLATVNVMGVNNRMRQVTACSGTTLTAEGHILTGLACVRNLDTGRLFNDDGKVVIAIPTDEVTIPQPDYIAEVVGVDETNLLAMLKITGMLANGRNLPDPLPVTPVELGDAAPLKVRDFVGMFGFPIVGDRTITYSGGRVAGFADSNDDDEPDLLKLTANVNEGNTGGLIVDADGRMVGMPLAPSISQEGDRMGYALMINRAYPLIAETTGISPQAQAPAASVARMTGRVVDADTNRGIPDAIVILLKPGVSWDQFRASGFAEELVAAAGSTNRRGEYQTAPGLARGQTYTVIVAADGYHGRAFDNALEVTDEDPELIQIQDIVLRKQ